MPRSERSSNSVANSNTSTSTGSSSSSNSGSPIKEIPSIGSTCHNRVSHSVSVPLNLFHVQKPPDINSLPNNKSDMDAARFVFYPYTVFENQQKCLILLNFGHFDLIKCFNLSVETQVCLKAQCLKITEKVAFIKNVKNSPFWRDFEKLKVAVK